MKRILFLLTIMTLASCGVSKSIKLANKTFPQIGEDVDVFVLQKNEIVPNDSEFIGYLEIGDTGFTTDCGYNKVVSAAITEAKNAGANIIQITKIRTPSVLWSTCYRIKVRIYRNLNPKSLAHMGPTLEQMNRSSLPKGSNYALTHIAGIGSKTVKKHINSVLKTVVSM